MNTETTKIVIDDTHTLNHWCDVFNCLEQDLLQAIRTIGNSVQAVDDYLVLNRKKLSQGMDL